jgi:hypothetical protein
MVIPIISHRLQSQEARGASDRDTTVSFLIFSVQVTSKDEEIFRILIFELHFLSAPLNVEFSNKFVKRMVKNRVVE